MDEQYKGLRHCLNLFLYVNSKKTLNFFTSLPDPSVPQQFKTICEGVLGAEATQSAAKCSIVLINMKKCGLISKHKTSASGKETFYTFNYERYKKIKTIFSDACNIISHAT